MWMLGTDLWSSGSGPLEEQGTLFTTEPSLQHLAKVRWN